MGRWHKKQHEETENKELGGLAASRIAIIGNYMLWRPKYSTNEVVAPKEEEVSQYFWHINDYIF